MTEEQTQPPVFKAIILDTETTGFKRPMGCIEVAYLGLFDLDYYAEKGFMAEKHFTYQQRFDTNRPIELGAQQVHKIKKEHLKGQPLYKFEDLGITDSVEYMLAHNAVFDHEVLGYPEQFKLICTVKLAKKFWPGRRSYKLTKLIEEFFPEIFEKITVGAHGALVDSKLVLVLLNKAMQEFEINSWEELYEFCES